MRKLLALMLFCFPLVFLKAQDADGVYTKVDENPAPMKTVKPDYPTDLKRQGIAGLVALACVIDEKGDVTGIKVSKSSNSSFEAPAIAALQKWKFRPAKKDGKEVKVRVTIPFRFNVDD
jgi:protein TonB